MKGAAASRPFCVDLGHGARRGDPKISAHSASDSIDASWLHPLDGVSDFAQVPPQPAILDFLFQRLRERLRAG